MSKNSDDYLVFVIGTLLGVVSGVVAGIMYSPRPGVEMRQELKQIAKTLSKEVPTDVEAAKETFNKSVDKLKVVVEDQINRIDNTVKAGKMASAKRKEEEMETGF